MKVETLCSAVALAASRAAHEHVPFSVYETENKAAMYVRNANMSGVGSDEQDTLLLTVYPNNGIQMHKQSLTVTEG